MNKKLILYILTALMVLSGFALVLNSMYQTSIGNKDYFTDPTIKM